MKVLIIEDEPLAAERLAQLIHEYESHIEVVDILDTVEGAVEWLKRKPRPDLIFLDIQLADGLSFQIFEKVKVEVPVIFITAYDSYAIQAFKMNSVDYLLKPISFEELAQAMDKFVKVFWDKKAPQQVKVDLEVLKEALRPKISSYKSRFVVKRGEQLYPVSVQEILYFYSEDKATLFKTRDKQRFLIEGTLNEVEAKLDPQQFFRVNRKFICRIEAIKEIITYSQRRLRLKLRHAEDEEVLVSREKVQQFKDWLDQ